MRKISKWKKFKRVFKRKLLKPLLIAAFISFILYQAIAATVQKKTLNDLTPPKFTISRITENFDETEFMHMLLTIQELNKIPNLKKDLYEFANSPFPSPCSKLLTKSLNQMNWEPQAFLIRVKKLFALSESYERIEQLDETIAFLTAELNEMRLPEAMRPQIHLLEEERNRAMKTELTPEEYNFIKEYNGFAVRLKKL